MTQQPKFTRGCFRDKSNKAIAYELCLTVGYREGVIFRIFRWRPSWLPNQAGRLYRRIATTVSTASRGTCFKSFETAIPCSTRIRAEPIRAFLEISSLKIAIAPLEIGLWPPAKMHLEV